jgi:hypothetical protein
MVDDVCQDIPWRWGQKRLVARVSAGGERELLEATEVA